MKHDLNQQNKITSEPSNSQIKWWEKELGRNAPSNCAWLCKDDVIVCFFNYTGDDVELAIAGKKGWATRQFVTYVFIYTYLQLKCVRCTVRVAASNTISLKMVNKLGFKCEGIIRQALNGEDCLIFGMLETESRWHIKRGKTSGKKVKT